LPIDLYAIDKDGRLTDICGPFAGMNVEEAVDAVIEHLDNI
jgi:valyl-tRNA synthetase